MYFSNCSRAMHDRAVRITTLSLLPKFHCDRRRITTLSPLPQTSLRFSYASLLSLALPKLPCDGGAHHYTLPSSPNSLAIVRTHRCSLNSIDLVTRRRYIISHSILHTLTQLRNHVGTCYTYCASMLYHHYTVPGTLSFACTS